MTVLKMLTLVLTAIILVPGAAHLFELPAKIDLDRDAYFTVQAIYAGWALFGIPIAAAIAANAALFLKLRRTDKSKARWALVSALLIATSLVVFFIWVQPANRATANWTMIPDDWEELRRQWEYGHAANAIIIFSAFVATVMATVKR